MKVYRIDACTYSNREVRDSTAEKVINVIYSIKIEMSYQLELRLKHSTVVRHRSV